MQLFCAVLLLRTDTLQPPDGWQDRLYTAVMDDKMLVESWTRSLEDARPRGSRKSIANCTCM